MNITKQLKNCLNHVYKTKLLSNAVRSKEPNMHGLVMSCIEDVDRVVTILPKNPDNPTLSVYCPFMHLLSDLLKSGDNKSLTEHDAKRIYDYIDKQRDIYIESVTEEKA